jgi:hypothetical protein
VALTLGDDVNYIAPDHEITYEATIVIGSPPPIGYYFDTNSLLNNEYGGRLFIPYTTFTAGDTDVAREVADLIYAPGCNYDRLNVDLLLSEAGNYGDFTITITARSSSTEYEAGTSVEIPLTYGFTPVMRNNTTTINGDSASYSLSESSVFKEFRQAYLAFRRSNTSTSIRESA